jgi:hypothetical protein
MPLSYTQITVLFIWFIDSYACVQNCCKSADSGTALGGYALPEGTTYNCLDMFEPFSDPW